MSLQIAKIILYSRKGEVRELPFKQGSLNVLTGASKSGKSAIIDIVDYCTGRSTCNVADGVIRKYVGWYAVLFQLGDSQIFVSRRNPEVGEKTSPDIYVERGSIIDTPAFEALRKNSTADSLETFLGTVVGINENEHRPPAPTRNALQATFRHALLFCFQDQNDVDSKQRLFHRQGEDFMNQAIKDTLPYFLGAIDEDALLKQSLLEQARRQLRQLERRAKDGRASEVEEFPRGRRLLEEAQQVGLISDRTHVLDEELIETLRTAISENRVPTDFIGIDGEDLLIALRAERQAMRNKLAQISEEARATRSFAFDTNGYLREAAEQRARLSAVGLVKSHDLDCHHCPVCQSVLDVPVPTAAQLERSLESLSAQLEAVEAENPRLQVRLARILEQKMRIEDELRENHQRISERIRENESLRAQQEIFVQQARVGGKIIQYLDAHRTATGMDAMRDAYRELRTRIEMLEADLDEETTRERIGTFLNIIGRYMTEYSDKLDLEHVGSQLRLDIRNLTVIADTMDGPVPLYSMGSGENWVGYHVLVHLALHKWFRLKGRPVPGFLILDQPSQAHYPPERDANGALEGLRDEDQQAVLKLFQLIATAAEELAPELQIIVLDHADLKRDWFDRTVIERWRGGKKLIPDSWLN
ncbi:DUF3732 domain-containing protein [Luteibacter flocculans]|uniref:DUF3732 domain-containing protein n=1 Tax=Luteibacter flocculans TaxID=2780091 RepID=A0ABY4T7F5_9GAMM|nr:DUF3732 domain-containing protein [Luteibacter flocculans]URL59863.1 DUF3732 domain-containing protein [Luteibacter flocculans]